MKILFSVVSVNKISNIELSTLFKSVKKYFLSNQYVDFIVFTDVDDTPNIDGITYINIDNSYHNVLTYFQFQKILSLNYINLDEYNFIFVCDSDSIFVNEVVESDVLTHDFITLNHFSNIKTKDYINQWTDIFTIDDEIEHIMGNFWGGNSKTVKKLLEFTNVIWDEHKDYDFNGCGFFSLHSEEVVIVKFLVDYNIKEKRLSSSLDYNVSSFLTDLKGYGNLLNNLHNFKLIHDTKYLLRLYSILF